jgi:hypothetical protein
MVSTNFIVYVPTPDRIDCWVKEGFLLIKIDEIKNLLLFFLKKKKLLLVKAFKIMSQI